MRPEEIVNKHFTKVFWGYDVQEVDLFLDDFIIELENREKERDVLLSRIEFLLDELERYENQPHNTALESEARQTSEEK